MFPVFKAYSVNTKKFEEDECSQLDLNETNILLETKLLLRNMCDFIQTVKVTFANCTKRKCM